MYTYIPIFVNYVMAPCRVAYNRVCDYSSYYLGYSDNVATTTTERVYSDSEPFTKLVRFFSKPTHIVDNIYLGSAYNAASYYALKDIDIGLVLNVTNEISQYYPNHFEYKQYNLYDNNNDTIKIHLRNSYNEIKKFQKNSPDKNIFIHCFMGASRSASIIIYYLMKTHKSANGQRMTFEEALEYIKNKRDIVNISNKFKNDIDNISMSSSVQSLDLSLKL